jgi:hypothetical protein
LGEPDPSAVCKRDWRRAAACASALLASGCGGSDVATCIPPDAKTPAAALASNHSATTGHGAPVAVDLYLDASESMKGFLTPPKSKEGMNYEKVVNDLTGYAGQRSRIAFAFGACVSELNPMERDLPLRPIFYEQLHKLKPVDCVDINKSTRFNVLLNKIKERNAGPQDVRGRLSIVVTDLFLDEVSRYLGGVPEALAQIQPIMDSGAAIAVLGVKVPFKGSIYLPPRTTQQGPPARPSQQPPPRTTQDTFLTLYVLAVGQPDHVRHLLSHLESSSFKGEVGDGRRVAASAAGENFHFHLFTKRRLAEPAVAISELSDEHGAVEPAGVGFIRGEVKPVSSLDLLEGAHPIAVAKPKWVEGTWPVDLILTTRTWLFYPRGSCERSWEALKGFPLEARQQDRAIQLRFNEESLAQIHSGMIHLSHVEAVMQREAQPKPPKWLRDWSISAEGAWRLDGKNQAFFPTLELEQIMETMERAALKNAPESEKVAAFNIAYRKKP